MGTRAVFTKDLQDVKGISTIDARAETITKTPTWREPQTQFKTLGKFHEFPLISASTPGGGPL